MPGDLDRTKQVGWTHGWSYFRKIVEDFETKCLHYQSNPMYVGCSAARGDQTFVSRTLARAGDECGQCHRVRRRVPGFIAEIAVGLATKKLFQV
jgi:hypothetical protein